MAIRLHSRAGLPAGQQLFASFGEARREANKLMASPAYTNRDHPEHGAVVEQVQQLFERAYDEG